MFLVYLYGRRHRDGVNAYPIVEPQHFVAYQDGVERNLHELPSEINIKLQYGDVLSPIENELHAGLSQIKRDLLRSPRERTHPLDERRRSHRRQRQGDEGGDVSSMSMTSSTSFNSSLQGIDTGIDFSSSSPEENAVSPTKRPRSEYSLSHRPSSGGSAAE